MRLAVERRDEEPPLRAAAAQIGGVLQLVEIDRHRRLLRRQRRAYQPGGAVEILSMVLEFMCCPLSGRRDRYPTSRTPSSADDVAATCRFIRLLRRALSSTPPGRPAIQDDAVGQHLQMIGAQRRAGRGDVDDDIGRARRRRAFGGAEAFDDAVDLDAVLLREELLGQPPVFGGDAQPAAMALAEIGGDVVEVGHGVDVEPDLGHGDHDIGMAEAERAPRSRRASLPVGERLRATGPRR